MSKRKLYLPSKQVIKSNFLTAYMAAGAPLNDFWYQDVYFECLELAVKYRLPYEIIAAVIATLSPLTPWSKNVENACKVIEFALENRQVLERFFNGPIVISHITTLGAITDLFAHVQGYNKNKAKALKIALYGDVSYCSGPKVEAFFDNIAHPTSERVTIDIWMFRLGLWNFTVHIKRNPYTKYADLFAKALQELAHELGLRPKQLQAIVWKQAQVISKIELAKVPA